MMPTDETSRGCLPLLVVPIRKSLARSSTGLLLACAPSTGSQSPGRPGWPTTRGGARHAAVAWWPAGTFIEAYRQNRKEAVELSIEANPVATAVGTFMANRDLWRGTASLLLEALTAVVSERVARSQAWPTVPHVLSGHLRRAAPNLRKIGISVEWSDRKNTVRATITIEKKSADDEKKSAHDEPERTKPRKSVTSVTSVTYRR